MKQHITVIYDTLQTIRNTRRAVQRSGEHSIQLAALRTIEHRAQALLRALQEQQFDSDNYQNHDISNPPRRASAVEGSVKTSRARRRALAAKSGRGRHSKNSKRWSR